MRGCLCVFVVPVIVASLSVWLAVRAPRSMQPLPAHQRALQHAVMLLFRGLIHGCEFLSDRFGYSYPHCVRPMLNSLIQPPVRDPRVRVNDLQFDGIPVRVYIPENLSNQVKHKSPAILYIHGGGWMFMSIDSHDVDCQRFAIELQAVVVSVGYRLIPEHNFPAPLDDCVKALKYLMRNAARWNVDPNRIAVAGDSAGGHLAAALSIRWRREVLHNPQNNNISQAVSTGIEPLPPIRLQVLIYPMLQGVNMSTTSLLLNEDLMLDRSFVARAWALAAFPTRGRDLRFLHAFLANRHLTQATRDRLAQYFEFGSADGIHDEVDSIVTAAERLAAARRRVDVESVEGDRVLEADVLNTLMDPEFSPLFVESFEDLPSAYVVTAGLDVLRDEGLAFVRRMRKQTGAAKSPNVGHKHYPSYPHGFMSTSGTNELQHDLALFLKSHSNFL